MSAGTKCTWDGCRNWASKPQLAKDGRQWANLCESHDILINRHIANGEAREIISDWVKAQGGAKAAAARML